MNFSWCSARSEHVIEVVARLEIAPYLEKLFILRLKVHGQVEHHVSGGHGPVDAMANVLIRALKPHYPNVERIRLIDYKVRVINPKAATAARVRVTIEFRDEQSHEIYSTVGVSENIIEASWIALVDGIEYKLIWDEERARKEKQKKTRTKKSPKKKGK